MHFVFVTGTPDVVESLTTSIREMVVKGNQELGNVMFSQRHQL